MTANPNWFTNGDVVNPATGDVLADTGALITGTYKFQVCVGATIAFPLAIQWRDSANTSNIRQILIPVPANTEFCMDLDIITDTDNERIRITVFSAALGRVQGTIINRV